MEDLYKIPLKGQFLVAMPSLADPNFNKTVSIICEHSAHGAMGLVVNRIYSAFSCKEIFDELGIACDARFESIPVHFGGPVHVDEIFILHGPPFDWRGCLSVTDRLALSNTKDILNAIALGEGPELFIITLGCAGWNPGQLEVEIKENTWLTCPIDEDIVFQEPTESQWERAIRKMGIDPSLLSNAAGHA